MQMQRCHRQVCAIAGPRATIPLNQSSSTPHQILDPGESLKATMPQPFIASCSTAFTTFTVIAAPHRRQRRFIDHATAASRDQYSQRRWSSSGFWARRITVGP